MGKPGGSVKLYFAAFDGRLEKVKALLSDGADPNYRTKRDGDTPLAAAAGCGHVDVVRALLEAGADPDVRDDVGDTADERARQRGLTDCCAAIAEARAARSLNATQVGWQGF